LFNIDLEVRMKKENDKDLIKAMKYLNDKIADIADTVASMETKLEKMERKDLSWMKTCIKLIGLLVLLIMILSS